MSNSNTAALPLEVGQIGSFEARMLRKFRSAVDDWNEVCSALGPWEAQHLTREEPGPAKEQHRVWVVELISWGQLLQRVTTHSAFPDHELAARLDARLRHLQDKLALWHHDMNAAKEERIVRTAFA
ncbi:MAG: hypothetical protein FJ398_16795 [Verrucomicrobia bacterium]|nr:hypothetical protein [Verrucomicrobiota bacterium]